MGNVQSNSENPPGVPPVLTVLLGVDTGKSFILNNPRVTIGRGEDRDVQLTDRAISRMHCEIEIQEQSLIIRDSGSQNGIKVNGSPVIAQELHDGDQIDIGSTLLVVTIPFKKDDDL